MNPCESPALKRFLARGGWLVIKSALNSVIATLVLALALFASLTQ
jgi:hypothetical protein